MDGTTLLYTPLPFPNQQMPLFTIKSLDVIAHSSDQLRNHRSLIFLEFYDTYPKKIRKFQPTGLIFKM